MTLDLVSSVPYDARLIIFSHLNKSDLARCSQINSTWNTFVNDSEVWKEIAAKTFTYGILKTPNIKSFLKKISHQNLKSNEQIIDRIQSFLDKVKTGQRAKFSCFLGTGRNFQTIFIQIYPRQIIHDMRGYELSEYPEWAINHANSDLVEDCFSLHRSDGYLLSYPEPIILKDDTSCIRSHRAWVELPLQLHSSQLNKKIYNLMIDKMDQLESEQQLKNKRLYTNIAATTLLLLIGIGGLVKNFARLYFNHI